MQSISSVVIREHIMWLEAQENKKNFFQEIKDGIKRLDEIDDMEKKAKLEEGDVFKEIKSIISTKRVRAKEENDKLMHYFKDICISSCPDPEAIQSFATLQQQVYKWMKIPIKLSCLQSIDHLLSMPYIQDERVPKLSEMDNELMKCALLSNKLQKFCAFQDIIPLSLGEKSHVLSYTSSYLLRFQDDLTPNAFLDGVDYNQQVEHILRGLGEKSREIFQPHFVEYWNVYMKMQQCDQKITTLFAEKIGKWQESIQDRKREIKNKGGEEVPWDLLNSNTFALQSTNNKVVVVSLQYRDFCIINGISLEHLLKSPRCTTHARTTVSSLMGKMYSSVDALKCNKMLPCFTHVFENQEFVFPFFMPKRFGEDIYLPSGEGVLLSFVPNRFFSQLRIDSYQDKTALPTKVCRFSSHKHMTFSFEGGATIEQMMRYILWSPLERRIQNIEFILHYNTIELFLPTLKDFFQNIITFVMHAQALIDAKHYPPPVGRAILIVDWYHSNKPQLDMLLTQIDQYLDGGLIDEECLQNQLQEILNAFYSVLSSKFLDPSLISKEYTWYIHGVSQYSVEKEEEATIIATESSSLLHMPRHTTFDFQLSMIAALPYMNEINQVMARSPGLQTQIAEEEDEDLFLDFYVPYSVLREGLTEITKCLENHLDMVTSCLLQETMQNLCALITILDLLENENKTQSTSRRRRKKPSTTQQQSLSLKPMPTISPSASALELDAEELTPPAASAELEPEELVLPAPGVEEPPQSVEDARAQNDPNDGVYLLLKDFEQYVFDTSLRDVLNHQWFRSLSLTYKVSGGRLILSAAGMGSLSYPIKKAQNDPNKKRMHLKKVCMWLFALHVKTFLNTEMDVCIDQAQKGGTRKRG